MTWTDTLATMGSTATKQSSFAHLLRPGCATKVRAHSRFALTRHTNFALLHNQPKYWPRSRLTFSFTP